MGILKKKDVSSKKLTSKRTYLLKAFLKMKILYFTSHIINYSVCDKLLPHLKKKSQKVFYNLFGKIFFKQQSYIPGLDKLAPSIM